MKRVFITTTESIENAKILEYKGTVLSTIVAGTGFFSDFAAGLTDFFGGRSGTYKRHMEDIYSEALDEISSQATRYAANAIIGCRVDFNSIPGKGMSMLMIAISGTAVNVEFHSEQKQESGLQGVSEQFLENEIQKRKILARLSEGWYPSEKEWNTIKADPQDDYAMPLVQFLVEQALIEDSSLLKMENTFFMSNYSELIPLLSRQTAISALYTLIQNPREIGFDIIEKNLLFDAKSISGLVDKQRLNIACKLLTVKQPYYCANDLADMKALSMKIHNLPDIGKIEIVKGGVFSKEAEKYICPDGHVNGKEVDYCEKCGKNIKGLTESNVEALTEFDKRIEALEYLLNRNEV